jgi:hypothetical protein
MQRTAGNHAVARMLACSAAVTPEDHPFEREAERAELLVTRSPQVPADTTATAPSRRPSPLADGPGTPLDAGLRRRLEPSLGSLAGVRVHTGPHADTVTSTAGAQALTHGSDVFVGRSYYRPGTDTGTRLLAHEAAHATGDALASGQIHLKAVNKQLSFIKIKKKHTALTRGLIGAALSGIGAESASESVMTDSHGDDISPFGHWWVELGKLTDPTNPKSWLPLESYGWWPAHDPSLIETFKIQTVNGALNNGSTNDPHHGHRAEVEYHPVGQVDSAEDYNAARDRLFAEVRSFAHAYHGSWNWRFAWGKNCHTFIDQLKKAKKLHHRSAKEVLVPPTATPASFKDILTAWEPARGTFTGVQAKHFRDFAHEFDISDLTNLSKDEKTQLASIVNHGPSAQKGATADDLNRALGMVFRVTLGPPDVFADEHIRDDGAKRTGATAAAATQNAAISLRAEGVGYTDEEVDSLLEDLEETETYTFGADFSSNGVTAKAGQKFTVNAVTMRTRSVNITIGNSAPHDVRGVDILAAQPR